MQVNSAEASTSSDGPSVRIPVDVRRFPWIRRLAADYAYDFHSVAPFFSGDPADRATAFRSMLTLHARVSRASFLWHKIEATRPICRSAIE